MRKSQVALAGRVKPGDVILVNGAPKTIARIKRAQGRKPARGENLHLVADDGEIVRVNSTAPLRIQPSQAEPID